MKLVLINKNIVLKLNNFHEITNKKTKKKGIY